MFLYRYSTADPDSEADSLLDGRTIRFVDRTTIIQDRRRKTIKVPKIFGVEEPDDPELEEILSLGSMDIDPEMCELPRLLAVTMASIMDDAVESCFIMAKTFGLPDVAIDISEKTLQDRNELLRSHTTLFNPDTLEDYSKTQNSNMLRKMHEDILFLQTVLAKGVKSLLTQASFLPWLMCLDNYELELEQDSKLLEMVERKNEKLQQLREKLQSDKIKFQKDSDQLSLSIGKARDDVEDFIIESGIKQNYLENWEKSRRQQNTKTTYEKEHKFIDKIEQAQKDSEKETFVHLQIKSYMADHFKDIENSIQEWMNKYDQDIETKEEEILKMGFNLEKLTNDLEELHNLYDKRQQEMDSWLEKKAEKERIEEEMRYLNHIVTRIQAWWRGVMVRKKLGPYKPTKKKDKKKKKKK